MKALKIVGVFLVLALGFLAGFGYGRWYGPRRAASKGGRRIIYYVDPMHPAYKSDKPGIAPDCGMRLEPVYEDGMAGGVPGAAGPGQARPMGKVLHYRDPKDHSYISGKPGFNPESGNELEAVYENEPVGWAPGTIQISPERQQMIGVRYGSVEWTSEPLKFRVTGTVALDETRVSHVHTKYEGWVEKVFADFTGKQILKGQPLLTIYSPEMLAAQQELLLARRSRDILHAASGEHDYSASLLDATRRKLELWDLAPAQIDEVLQTGKPVKNITIYAPEGGYITERMAFPSLKATPEMNLFTIVDLSRVWVIAAVHEQDAANVRLGQAARIRQPYGAAREFPAQVSYILPQVETTARTLKVRLELENPDLALKPDMFVDVEFRIDTPRSLSVPAEAILDSGDRQLVFVDRGNGYLEPRMVETGDHIGSKVVILRGLKAGERIVTSGNFLIDSESQLKAALSGAGGHSHD
jgi:RND family efflux transporter MFP subunit